MGIVANAKSFVKLQASWTREMVRSQAAVVAPHTPDKAGTSFRVHVEAFELAFVGVGELACGAQQAD